VGLPEIENLFFSRRNFSQPERQLGPHKNFADEVKVLDQHCDGSLRGHPPPCPSPPESCTTK
jgi:hypothetical protein